MASNYSELARGKGIEVAHPPPKSSELSLFRAKGDLSAARVIAKEFIRQHLNFPEEASFPWTPSMATPLKDYPKVFFVFGTVTGKNAFGVRKQVEWGAFVQQPESRSDKHSWRK